jgi:hypothetical protein
MSGHPLRTKQPSISSIQLEPDGGLSAGDGRQGSMNLVSAASRLRIRSINMSLI